jgi:hypothetical protein
VTTEPQRSTIATSSQGTSEKIIMETATEDVVSHILDWAKVKMENLHESDRHRNARAIQSEFSEWFDAEESDNGELEITCISLMD